MLQTASRHVGAMYRQHDECLGSNYLLIWPVFRTRTHHTSVARFKFWNWLARSKKLARLSQNRINYFSVKISPKKPKFYWISIFFLLLKYCFSYFTELEISFTDATNLIKTWMFLSMVRPKLHTTYNGLNTSICCQTRGSCCITYQWPYHGLSDQVFFPKTFYTWMSMTIPQSHRLWYGHWRLGSKMYLKKMKKPRSVRPWYGRRRTVSKTWLKKKMTRSVRQWYGHWRIRQVLLKWGNVR